MGSYRLEMLQERRGRLAIQAENRKLQARLDAVDLRITEVELAFELTRLAFHAGVPMDKIRDMVVTRSGVKLKEGS